MEKFLHGSLQAAARHVVVLLCVVVSGSLVPAVASAQAVAAADPLIDWPMDDQPKLPEPQTISTFDPALGSLWLQALNRPDSRTRFEAAEAIAKAAGLNMPGLEMMASRLTSIVSDSDENPLTRQAAAKALIAMNARDRASALLEAQSDTGQAMILLTDPALARWRDGKAVTLWLQRLADASLPQVIRQSAATSLGTVGDTSAAGALVKLALDVQTPASLRLAAARAYGELANNPGTTAVNDVAVNSGLIALASSSESVFNQLIAARLLRGSHSPAGVKLLVELAGNDDATHSPVAIIAAQRLMQISPESLDPLLAKLGKSADAGVRKIVITRLAQQGTEHTAQDVARFLSDINPKLRVLARSKLTALASEPKNQAQVSAAITQVLAGQNPLGLEQAALAAGVIDLKSSASRLVTLLDDPHTPVAVAAATSLRKLQVASTLEPILAYVEANLHSKIPEDRHNATAQLIQLLGIMKYAPAKPVFMKIVPKNSASSIDRTAAIWSLGLLNQGHPDPALISQLIKRANDGQGMNPEDGPVRVMAVVAIGRMTDTSSLNVLRRWMADKVDESLAPASRWAIGEITGDRPPEPDPVPSRVTGWFLEPARK